MLVGGRRCTAVTHWKREARLPPAVTRAWRPRTPARWSQKLKEGGVEYRLSRQRRHGAGAVATVAELRLQMAAAGLPKTGRIGFELFDKTNFGATEFTEQINYRRALEGELERSVMALAEVEQARVHLTFPKDSVFLEARQPAKASVMVKLRPGAQLSPQNVTAINHLVASAVEGLAPEAVSVLDMRGNLLNRPRTAPAAGRTRTPPRRRSSTGSRSKSDLLAKINSTLEPLLGRGRFRAGVSVECDFTSGEQSEETFDPDRSVMVTSQKTEDVDSARRCRRACPGTASNLPRPASRPGAGRAGDPARRRTSPTRPAAR